MTKNELRELVARARREVPKNLPPKEYILKCVEFAMDDAMSKVTNKTKGAQ